MQTSDDLLTVSGASARARAVLIVGVNRPAISTARTLTAAGWRVGVAGSRARMHPSLDPRRGVRWHQVPSLLGPAAPVAERLCETVRAGRYEVVVAPSEIASARLADVDLGVPVAPIAGAAHEQLVDKLGLARLCAALDIAYPRTVVAADARDDEAAIAGLGVPLVVKASRTAMATPERVVRVLGATVARDRQEALAALRALRDAGALPIVQERIDGIEKLNAVVLRRGGSSELRYAQRVVREPAPHGGAGVTLESLSVERGSGAEAVALLERVCAAVGYEGIVLAELYRARRDGRLYVFDVNPRLWGSAWFAEQLGLRPAERTLRQLLGEPALPVVQYEVGRRFHHLEGERSWALAAGASPRAWLSIVSGWRPGDVYEAHALASPRAAARTVGRRLRSSLRAGPLSRG